ncbi:hypothetical protein LZ30DRAFT_196684 [Colletotrichum cereale]|nr:hypothetical protein LZ30DRAFT_196684 [Colletotrichum cereale]
MRDPWRGLLCCFQPLVGDVRKAKKPGQAFRATKKPASSSSSSTCDKEVQRWMTRGMTMSVAVTACARQTSTSIRGRDWRDGLAQKQGKPQPAVPKAAQTMRGSTHGRAEQARPGYPPIADRSWEKWDKWLQIAACRECRVQNAAPVPTVLRAESCFPLPMAAANE